MDKLNPTEYLVAMLGWGVSAIFFLASAAFLYKKCGHIEGEGSKKKPS